MWFARPRGRLSLPLCGYSSIFGENDDKTAFCILEIVSHGVADCLVNGKKIDPQNVPVPGKDNNLKIEVVTSSNGKITLVNRRWDREEKNRQGGNLRQKKFRESGGKRKSNADVTPGSSNLQFSLENNIPDFPGEEDQDSIVNDGPQYRTKNDKILTGVLLDGFNDFWIKFNYKHGKAEAADAWYNLAYKTYGVREFIKIMPEISAAAIVEARDRPNKEQKGKSVKWAQGWLSARRFEDEVYKQATRSIYDDPNRETELQKMKRWKKEMEEEDDGMSLAEYRQKWETDPEFRKQEEEKGKGKK
jgi:hypothetical protein